MSKTGYATVGISGFWARIVCALQVLFLGEMTFRVSPENFEMEGSPDSEDQPT